MNKEWYYSMLAEQNNVCAICKQAESIVNGPVNKKPKRLAIDHCHTTGKIRGLLCHKCNVSIGAMADSVERLKSAIAYLEKHCIRMTHPDYIAEARNSFIDQFLNRYRTKEYPQSANEHSAWYIRRSAIHSN